MKLLGLIIRDYENLISKQIFHFSDEYTINFDWNETITIHKNPHYIADFYGGNVTNITAIVGINGVGKTSLLNFIGFKFSERKEFLDKYEYFIFYEMDESIFIEFNNNHAIKQIIFNNQIIKTSDNLIGDIKTVLLKKEENTYQITNSAPNGSINYIFKKYHQYSFSENNDKFDTLFGKNWITRYLCQVPSNYNVIQAFRFLKINAFFSSNKIMKYRISYWSYDEMLTLLLEKSIYNENILTLLGLSSKNSDNSLPHQFTNQIVAFLINFMLTLKERYIFWNEDIEELLLNQILEYLALNFQNIRIDILYHKTDETSQNLKEYFKNEQSKIDENNNHQITDFINFSIEAMQLLWKTSDYLEVDHNSFIIDFSSETIEINDFLMGYRQLLHCNKINSKGIVVFPEDNLFFKLHELSSTGEENLIQFLGQLIELISNAESGNHIILIDEVDESFHPSWSNKIVQLLSVCCTYFLDVENSSYQNPTFQFIITTHSPFILSDIKNQNVISLKEKHGKVISKQVNTFAKNIQRIIYDEMDTGDIYGNFAQNKLNKIVNILNLPSISTTLIEKTKIEIQTINEPLIRNKLNQMLFEKVSPNEKVNLLISNLTDEELALLKDSLSQ
ncbi:AAA family ATPase [Streptococcus pacificus]|uniref:AAA family ATPase n=1 Tax=Streptococcus pacificus TaxID=2740577 RepID=A0ABS0ZGV7_9STRE|nr:AAA family ATPase [Streptococcus pacificus]MBJ8325244.1 AAA family ATPase [Streptococcus pacificus]